MSNWNYVAQYFIGIIVVAAGIWISPFRPKHWCCRFAVLALIMVIMAHNMDW